VTLPILNKLHKYSTVFEVLQSGYVLLWGKAIQRVAMEINIDGKRGRLKKKVVTYNRKLHKNSWGE